MKLKKRIIFTLLYSSGKFVLSRNFRLQNIGNLNWLIKNYNFNNVSFFIDELIILDVSRGERNITHFSEVIKIISQDIFVPISAGGGISSLKDVKTLLESGADKVVLNTNLLNKSKIVDEICAIYGKQCLVGSLDTKYTNGNYFLYSDYGKNRVGTLDECFQKFKISERVGEIYINSIDKDGTGNGLDLDIGEILFKKTKTPFILAGGIGKPEHIISALEKDSINAVSTAHLLNFIGNSLEITRQTLSQKGINLASWNDINQLKSKQNI